MAAGKYEAHEAYDFDGNMISVSWSDGDWNADGQFSSADLVIALADGGYEQGPRAVVTVPESQTSVLFGVGSLTFLLHDSTGRRRLSDPILCPSGFPSR